MGKKQPRIYEYVTQDGIVVWSFTRFPRQVTHSQKLILDGVEGTPLSQYLADLRGLGRVLGISDKDTP